MISEDFVITIPYIRCLGEEAKRRILVVDNERDITVALQIGLEDSGFSVDTFTDPSLALKSFKPNLYDLVLIDIVMPGIDGLELYDRLRKPSLARRIQ